MTVSKFGETAEIDKVLDLDNKNISLHMIEDHWQTGLLVFHERSLKFDYVPLNPYNNNESSPYKLKNVLSCILGVCRNIMFNAND